MSLHKPSVLQDFLKEISSVPKKNLSQNFLIDGNIIAKLLASANIEKDDIVLEIGPGPGAITEALLSKGAKVIAVEMDQVFSEKLKRLNTCDNLLTVICKDFLKINLSEVLEEHLTCQRKIKVVSNLPFKLTSPILEKLFETSKYIETITVIVQKEVGIRFTAKPKTSQYSSFSVFVQLYTKPKYIHTISPNSFYPRPRVQSAILHCETSKENEKYELLKICQFVRKAFQMKRKMLLNSLKVNYPLDLLQQVFTNLDINFKSRPSDLSPKDYITLYEAIQASL